MADQKNSAVYRYRKTTSPLLLSQKAMELTLAKERMRCDRYGHCFSLLVLQMPNDTSHLQLQLLAKVLHRRLRLTDEKGLLLKGGIGILLPMTDQHGAKVVQNSITQSAARNGLDFESEIFTYSGRDNCDLTTVSDLDTKTAFDDEFCSDDTIVDGAQQRLQTSTTTLPTLSRKIIRADDESQSRSGALGELVETSTLTSTHVCPRYPAWKRGMDICCASTGLLVSMPVILVAAIAIKMTSKGPVFFSPNAFRALWKCVPRL